MEVEIDRNIQRRSVVVRVTLEIPEEHFQGSEADSIVRMLRNRTSGLITDESMLVTLANSVIDSGAEVVLPPLVVSEVMRDVVKKARKVRLD